MKVDIFEMFLTRSIGRKPVFGPDQLNAATFSKLRSLQKLPNKIASLFKHPDFS